VERTMEARPPVLIQISRREVEALDTTCLVGILDSFAPDLMERNRNRVQLEVCGYLEDKRELFDIPEVRAFFAKLFDETDSLLYWIDFDSKIFVLLGLMLYPPVRVEGQVTLEPFHLQAFLQRGFGKLNHFCERWQTSAEPTTRLVRQSIGMQGV
jgi:hypothetical protein